MDEQVKQENEEVKEEIEKEKKPAKPSAKKLQEELTAKTAEAEDLKRKW